MIDNNKIKKSKEAIVKYVDFNKINNLRHIAKVFYHQMVNQNLILNYLYVYQKNK